jgi:hypothetical protein
VPERNTELQPAAEAQQQHSRKKYTQQVKPQIIACCLQHAQHIAGWKKQQGLPVPA